jgi:hypothetical protein
MFATWAMCCVSSGVCQESEGKPSGKSAPRVLVDAYHAHSWIDTMPSVSLNQYHLLHGPSRLIHALRSAEWQCEAQLGPWTKDVLSKCDVIYMNLVSADRPSFTVDEVLAIEDFVKKGGGLFLVTDHTNCYFHNHVLGSLAERLDLELTNELLCDRSPHTTGPGNAWVVLTSFHEHPITRGLERIAFQSGGCVDSRYGIIHSSNLSWGDWANIPVYGDSNSPGFYGDFLQQPMERTGPLAAVAAKEFGNGRIVVLGDQNCFGGVFLNYLDNRRLALQSFHWLAKRECDESKILSNREKDRTLVWCLENANGEETDFGNGSETGLYHLYAWLGKMADVRATHREIMDAELLVISLKKEQVSPQTMAVIQRFLAKPSKAVLILDSQSRDAKSSELDPLTRGFVQGKTEKEGELRYTKWYNSVESNLIICKNEGGWNNKQFPGPEVTMNATQHAMCNHLIRLLSELGVHQEMPRTKSWLEERDE